MADTEFWIPITLDDFPSGKSEGKVITKNFDETSRHYGKTEYGEIVFFIRIPMCNYIAVTHYHDVGKYPNPNKKTGSFSEELTPENTNPQ